MSTETKDPVVTKSYLDMSDEELMNAPPPVQDDDAENEESTAAESTAIDADDAADDDVEPAAESAESAEADGDDEQGDSPGEESAADEGEKTEEEVTPPKSKEKPEVDPKAQKAEEEKPKEAAELDYKAEYQKLLAPFRANGREITVKNVDDAIALMQMGANYNKKMAALKPNLKLMKMLENNKLLTEEKIGFLIDLGNKNPEAINKLVSDSGLNPMDLDAEKASGYKQTSYAVDDREIELDTVLDEIQDTKTYNRTLEIVSNKWDGASKQVIAGSPQLLKVINDHIANGIYDIISQEVESERVFGRLKGLSDIEAYRQVGDSIQARGGFNHLSQGSSPAQRQPATKPVVVTPKPKQVDDDKLKDKRRAASSTRPVASNTTPKDFNPLAMSDEEFSKQVNNKFL